VVAGSTAASWISASSGDGGARLFSADSTGAAPCAGALRTSASGSRAGARSDAPTSVFCASLAGAGAGGAAAGAAAAAFGAAACCCCACFGGALPLPPRCLARYSRYFISPRLTRHSSSSGRPARSSERISSVACVCVFSAGFGKGFSRV
jgi:hypothetical protein